MKDPGNIFEVFDPKDYADHTPHKGSILEEYFPDSPPTRGESIWNWTTLIIAAVQVLAIVGFLIYSLVR